MPNWCSNNITVSGEQTLVKRFDEQFRQPHTFVDCGAEDVDTKKFLSGEFKEQLAEYESYSIEETHFTTTRLRVIRGTEKRKGYALANFVPIDQEGIMKHGWYNWAIDNWGTKWDVHEVSAELHELGDGQTEANYCFETAWSGVDPVLEAMSRQFPGLSFYYFYNEEGAEFAGIIEYEDGKEVSHKSSDDYPGGYMKFCLVELEDTSYGECPECEEFFSYNNAESLPDGTVECPDCFASVPFIT